MGVENTLPEKVHVARLRERTAIWKLGLGIKVMLSEAQLFLTAGHLHVGPQSFNPAGSHFPGMEFEHRRSEDSSAKSLWIGSEEESADSASHRVGQQETGKLSGSGHHYLVHKFAQVLHIGVKGVDVDHIIFGKFSAGITVAALLEKEDRIACLPQVPGKFVVFAPEPAIAVQYDYNRFGIRVFRVIVVEFDPVPCSDFTVLYMLLPPEPVLSLHCSRQSRF